ncbi:SIMPL domain-containing protein, partial [uncultured Massilia sp.]
PEGQPLPMDTRVSIHLTVRDLGQWTPLLRSLLVMKNIESLAVSFNRSDRGKIEDDLLEEALGKAKLKAQKIAKGVGARLGAAAGVSVGALKNLSNAMGMSSDPFARNVGERRASPKGSEMALVQAMRLGQAVDVIYRIGNAGR